MIAKTNFENEYYENPMFWEEERYLGAETKKIELALNLIPSDVESVLDIGCGNGFFINRVSKKHTVVGADRSWAALQHVKKTCCQADLEFLPFSDKSFDIVVAMEVLEHLAFKSFIKSLEELARVSRHYVLITVPFKERLSLLFATCPECGCKFHRWYHMRSFSKLRMKTLFNNLSNPLLPAHLEGALVVKKVPLLSDMFRLLRWRYTQSFPDLTICPQCGFKNERQKTKDKISRKNSKLPSDILKRIEKLIPLKVTTYRWWIALYEKR